MKSHQLAWYAAFSACILLAGCGSAGGPIYALGPTAACLRAHGYTVSRPYPFHWAGKADPTIEVDGARDTEFLSFSPSVKKAQADSDATRYGLVIRRNVVFNAEGINGLPPQAVPIVNCLRSR